jgi:hypothetical protein
MELEKQNK